RRCHRAHRHRGCRRHEGFHWQASVHLPGRAERFHPRRSRCRLPRSWIGKQPTPCCSPTTWCSYPTARASALARGPWRSWARPEPPRSEHMPSITSSSTRILHVVGARPNFVKIAPIMHALAQHGKFQQRLVHTGQHYDARLSEVFFQELGMPVPDINLEVGSGSHACQTAEVMRRIEPVLLEFAPDWVLVPGDVNSTLAAALTACKLGLPVAHVEAGLRSFDRTMPEEINRVLTDHMADLLLTPSRDADANLAAEGIAPERVCFVGNVMIDTLVRLLPSAEARWPRISEI